MISNLLLTLERGFVVLKENSKLMLVGIVLFVFPIVFVITLQSFFTTAKQNIDTTQKQSVSLLHDTLSFSENQYQTSVPLLQKITTENQDIAKTRILVRAKDGFEIIAASDTELVGTIDSTSELLASLPANAEDQSIIFETSHNGDRIWQAFRRVELEQGFYYIFTEHNFARSDAVLLARERQAYMSLSLIFFFVLGLAFWIYRQSEWSNKYRNLQKTLEERNKFTHMIAHEFRTPLTAIKGYASFLRDDTSATADNQRFADNIFVSSERLVLLVNDFLQVARIQSGKLKLKYELVDIEALIIEVCDELRPIASEHNLSLVYHKQQSGITLHTDKNRLHQILLNLITNAIKYTESGSVEVEAIQRPQQLLLKIKDTGSGMSADDQRKLFKQFTRVGNVDNSKIIGSGLGMWITKQLVELLGGTIGIESIEDVGTHVIVTFPH